MILIYWTPLTLQNWSVFYILIIYTPIYNDFTLYTYTEGDFIFTDFKIVSNSIAVRLRSIFGPFSTN